MARYTEESLDKLHKKNFINIALFLKSKLQSVNESVISVNKKVLEEVRKLKNNFFKFEYKLKVLKQVNSLL